MFAALPPLVKIPAASRGYPIHSLNQSRTASSTALGERVDRAVAQAAHGLAVEPERRRAYGQPLPRRRMLAAPTAGGPGLFRRAEAEERALVRVLVLRVDDPVRLVVRDAVAPDRGWDAGHELHRVDGEHRHEGAAVEVRGGEEEAVGLRAVEDGVARAGLVEGRDDLPRREVPLDDIVRGAAAAAEERVLRRGVDGEPVRAALRPDVELLHHDVLRRVELEDRVLVGAREVHHPVRGVVAGLLEGIAE